MPSRPHILIFAPDQWRGDVMGHLGNPAARTPNLDRLVETEAVSFRYAFCQNPVCTPSRCPLMTGWYPHVRGQRTMFHPLLADPGKPHRDAVFCEGGRLRGEKHCTELESTENQKPTGLYWPRLSLQRRIPEHTKAVMLRTHRYKYVRRLYEGDELYDLQKDPCELHNLIDQPALEGVLARLKERMLDFLLETADVVPHDADRQD